jgi:hypothetical protein
MNMVITVPRPYGVAAYVKGMSQDIQRLRLPEEKMIRDSNNPDFALRRIGGFRSEAEVKEWCKQHHYWFPSMDIKF